MGLDLVELIMAVEECFAITIPDHDAVHLTTPRRIADYVEGALEGTVTGPLVLSRAYYRVRSAVASRSGTSLRSLTSETDVRSLWPAEALAREWEELRQEVGATRWPSTPTMGWLAAPATLGELARHVATHSPAAVLRDAERWTRPQIEEAVHLLVCKELGVERSAYNWDSRFIQDLHVD